MSQDRNNAKIKDWFYQIGTEVSVDGNPTRLAESHDPSESTMSTFQDSVAMFSEAESRAKQDTQAGLPFKSVVGLVSIASDDEAKAGISGVLDDRAKVVHAAQLPTNEAVSDTIDDFTGNVLDITADAGITTRNRFLHKFTSGFKSWLISRLIPAGGTTDQVLAKTDATDYNVYWKNDDSGGGGGITDIESATDTDIAGAVQGELMYFNAVTGNWERLPQGTSGQVLQSNGGGANPTWVSPSAVSSSKGELTGGGVINIYKPGTPTPWRVYDPTSKVDTNEGIWYTRIGNIVTLHFRIYFTTTVDQSLLYVDLGGNYLNPTKPLEAIRLNDASVTNSTGGVYGTDKKLEDWEYPSTSCVISSIAGVVGDAYNYSASLIEIYNTGGGNTFNVLRLEDRSGFNFATDAAINYIEGQISYYVLES
jgi:hypothetical protein